MIWPVHQVTQTLVTPAEAEAMLKSDLFALQRKISKNHIAFLARVMREGEFDNGAPIRFARLSDGRRFLVDGQQRLHALAANGVAIPLLIITTPCESVEAVAALYARIDRGRGRSFADAVRALRDMESEAFTQTELAALLAAAPFIATDFPLGKTRSGAEYEMKSAEARLGVARPYFAAARKYFNSFNGARPATTKLLLRREVAAIGIATYLDDEDNAARFWPALAADDGLRASDPRKQCLDFMRNTPPTPNGLGRLAVGIAICWMNARRNTEITFVRASLSGNRVAIAGTRWR